MTLPGAGIIERAALLAWPALESHSDDAWVLRAANGYTKRANSVQSLNPADDDNAPARIEAACRWFEARGLPPVFRVTPLAGTGILAALHEANWSTHDHSQLMAMELGAVEADPRAEALEVYDPRFLAAQQHLQGYDDETLGKLRAILNVLEVPSRGMVLHNEAGEAVASAVMSIAESIVVTGNVVTARAERRKGYAAAMMRTGLAWARDAGATVAALNVLADNEPAIGLYTGLGFRAQYEYRYRMPPVA